MHTFGEISLGWWLIRKMYDRGTDKGTESGLTGLGRVLQTSPRPNALPQTRRLDRAPHLVAPFPPVAHPGLAAVAPGEAV